MPIRKAKYRALATATRAHRLNHADWKRVEQFGRSAGRTRSRRTERLHGIHGPATRLLVTRGSPGIVENSVERMGTREQRKVATYFDRCTSRSAPSASKAPRIADVGRAETWFALVVGRFLDAIDDDDVDGGCLRLDAKPELFLNSGEESRWRVRIRRRGSS